jgi:hypothetical protein
VRGVCVTFTLSFFILPGPVSRGTAFVWKSRSVLCGGNFMREREIRRVAVRGGPSDVEHLSYISALCQADLVKETTFAKKNGSDT